ncbi:MAG: hypothetical protein H6R14_479 [Proteobacteria bacterium]|nr:hypothetical protein [Pseudomonadota bacterium]
MAMKPTDQEIGELYREAGPSGPSAELDRNILMAARAAVEPQSTPAPWWPRWRLPLQALATICLVAMLTTMVERHEPLEPAIPPLAMNDNSAAADKQQVASAAPSPAPVVGESRARMADQAPAPRRSEAKMAAPVPTPAPAATAQFPAGSEAVLSSAPAERSVATESAAAAPMARREALASPSAKAAARVAADQAKSPKDWLDSIQALINQNRLDEARKSLEAFAQAYPGEAVPDGIKTKLKLAPEGERSKQP